VSLNDKSLSLSTRFLVHEAVSLGQYNNMEGNTIADFKLKPAKAGLF